MDSAWIEQCPFQLGANQCECHLGHPGMHEVKSRFGRKLAVEMLWTDEWTGLSAEAATQIEGNGLPIPEA